MALITFDYRKPTQDGDDLPVVGTLTASLAEREILGGAFRTVASFVVMLVDGVAEAELSITGPNQYWVIKENAFIAGRKTWYKKVAASGAFTGLEDVDPTTALPTPGTSLADAFYAEVQAQVALAEGFKDEMAPGVAGGTATLDGAAKLPEAQVPVRLSETGLSATIVGKIGQLIQWAKNPDAIITGDVTGDPVTSAAVVWPDGTPGTLTITARHASGAVNAYNISYGSPATKTFTQPAITRSSTGAATNVPQIVVS